MANASLILQAIGGMPLILMGLAVLWLPRRRPDVLFLAGFSILWGVGVETIAVGWVTGSGPAFHAEFTLAYHVANVLAIGCLLGFVSWMRVRRSRRAPMTVTIVALVVVGLVGAFAGRDAGGSLSVAAYLAGFSFALWISYREYRRAAPGSVRQRERILLAALSIFPAYLLGSFLASGASGLRDAALIVPVFAIHAHAMLRPPPPERRDPWLALAFLVPFLAGAANLFTAADDGAGVAGLWRIATAALLAYAIARSRLFDVELRLRRVAAPTLGALLLLAGLIASAVMMTTGESAWASALPTLCGLGMGLMVIAARKPVGEAIFPVEASEARVRERKLEVYAAAVQAAAQAGLGDDTEEVRHLRRTFGVTATEHALIAAAAAPSRDERRLVLQRYRLLHSLGEGAQGSAFLARDERTGTDVAVKLVSRYGQRGATAEALLHEARLASSLEHRHVVRVLDSGVDGDDAALVMEFAVGGSLRGLLVKDGPALSPDAAFRLADDLLSALVVCHARGIVHGDVKPENILLDGATPPRAMLADFGIARDTTATAAATLGAARGTLLYMAPEQVKGEPARPESDVYATGIILHEMLTGRHPIPLAGHDDFHIRRLIVDGQRAFALRGPLASRAGLAIERALATRAEDRPNAAMFRSMLQEAAKVTVRP